MDLQHTTNRHQDPPCERTRFVFPNDLGSRAGLRPAWQVPLVLLFVFCPTGYDRHQSLPRVAAA
jgi:hypothetical protein